MSNRLRRSIRHSAARIARFLRRDRIQRAAAEGRGRNTVVGPTFGYHVVNRPGETAGREWSTRNSN